MSAIAIAAVLLLDASSGITARQAQVMEQALRKASADAMRDFREGRCILLSVGPAKGVLPGTDITMASVPSYFTVIDMEAGAAQDGGLSKAVHEFAIAYAPEYNRTAVKNCGRTL